MEPDELLRRAASFADVADAYERARPGYPDAAVRWLAGTEPRDVADLGAGTGKLTRSLVGLGHRVTAVEPLEEMLERLRAAVPAAATVVGRAEALPLPDASVDVVTCAQAFHWFDYEAALAEIARVLRPGGRLALVWNTRDDREPWVARLSAAMENRTNEARALAEALPASPLFEPFERATFAFAQRLDRAGLRDLVLSRSYCAVRSAEEREPVLAAVDAVFDERAEHGTVALPYLTECFRAAVRAPR
jgi:ubiquinone/menaquinone biosynthesis C-methylase UbiE